MKFVTRFSIILFVLGFLSSGMLAGEEKEMEIKQKVGGTVQSWVSYQQGDSVNSVGFGLRRVRVRYYATINTKFKAFVQADLTSNSLAGKLLDARIEYHFSPQFNIRAGRFVGAGVRGGGLTSHTAIDIIERAYSAIRWGSGTIGGDYRDFGVQAEAKAGDATARLFLHNGNGGLNVLNRAGGTATTEFTSKAVTAMGVLAPKSIKGLEVGGHYGMGNDDVKDWSSFSGYAYFEPGPIRLKAEVIGLTSKPETGDVTSMGYYIFGGYQVTPNVELVGRFETYDPDTDVDENAINFITLGVVFKEFSGKVNHKLTGAVVLPSEQGTSVDNTTAYAMWQLVF